MIAHFIKNEQNPAYDLLSKIKRIIHMANLIDEKRINQIINFLNVLNIKSERLYKIINSNDLSIINIFNEALTHSSEDSIVNYEKLEFYGDAVLRLAASDFIDRKYPNMSVGSRSELRAQIVSDEWLSNFGRIIDIEGVILKGPKAVGDQNARDTIIAEATEALIGALYKCFNSTKEVNIWLDEFWEKDSKAFLKDPHKFNSKSTLQEWCQKRGFELPIYKIVEVSSNHGDPKKFFCEIYLNGMKEACSFGQSHKKAQKNAAAAVIEQWIKEGKM